MVVGRRRLHIKYGMFGQHMNECMSGPSLVSAYRMCEHLNVFCVFFFPRFFLGCCLSVLLPQIH